MGESSARAPCVFACSCSALTLGRTAPQIDVAPALEASVRADLWRELVAAVEATIERPEELRALTEDDADEVRAFVGRLDFDAPLEPIAALRFAVEGLSRYSVNFHNPAISGCSTLRRRRWA